MSFNRPLAVVASAPRVFCHCYSVTTPLGGQRDTYHLVDALTELGVEACVFHDRSGFRLEWFSNHTPVMDESTFRRSIDPRKDYVVLPENLSDRIGDYPGKKILFNKSLCMGFKIFQADRFDIYPYAHPDVAGILAVSDHDVAHLRFAYPNARVVRVVPHIDGARFSWKPMSQRKAQIAWVPKCHGALSTLYHMLMSRANAGLNCLSQFTWIKLDGMTESEVIQALQESLLLIFISAEEGLGRIAIEAMACGCLVTGFENGTSQEILPRAARVPWSDFVELITFVERTAAVFVQDRAALEQETTANLALVEPFSTREHRRSVRTAWDAIERAVPPEVTRGPTAVY